MTKVSFTNGPVGIDDLRERLCFQAPLRAARNLIAAIDSKPWWETLLFSGGLHALLLAASACAPERHRERITKSLLKDPKVAELFLGELGASERFSLVDAIMTAYQQSVASTLVLRGALVRLLSPPSSQEEQQREQTPLVQRSSPALVVIEPIQAHA